jgi:hypothetical protein
VAFLAAVVMFILGVRARRRHRLEMARAVEAIPVQPVGSPSKSVDAI